jgi:hypothetical protein
VFGSDFPPTFDRDYGCTEADWLRWLPGAVRGCALSAAGDGSAHVAIGSGSLQLRWTVLPPRQIALMRMPRLMVQFSFEAVSDEARDDFMRYFDLYLQRGGG